jgi:hypothetical protein
MEHTDQETQKTSQKQLTIDEHKLERFMEGLKMEQNFPLAILGASLAALAGAAIWAAITVATKFQIGYMAVAVGIMVGFSVRYFGKGLDKIYGYLGAVFSLLGCLLGNFLSMVGFFANHEGMQFFEVLTRIDYSLVPSIMAETFSPIDLLFYGIAVYEGYKFSFRRITEDEIIQNAAKEMVVAD